MNSENVHVLANRIAKQNSLPQTGALQYLNAAHAKLKKLQAWRQRQKLEYALCVFERDTALREVEKLKFYADKKSHKLERARKLIDLQAQVIEELQGEPSGLRRNLKRREQGKAVDSDGPALTALALEKVAAQLNDRTNTADTAGSGVSSGLIASLMRRIRWRMIPS